MGQPSVEEANQHDEVSNAANSAEETPSKGLMEFMFSGRCEGADTQHCQCGEDESQDGRGMLPHEMEAFQVALEAFDPNWTSCSVGSVPKSNTLTGENEIHQEGENNWNDGHSAEKIVKAALSFPRVRVGRSVAEHPEAKARAPDGNQQHRPHH